ncbi:MAG: hypothetical protein GKR93_09295 [Gammaproteobacteria bacterium]|nr:hypothetical protein [Gammaproteobacteria bacterium]
MLQIIREKTSGVIAIVIVGLLIVTFAFWGVSYYFDQGGEVVAIKVNDADIELREYQRVYQNVRRQFQELLGENAGTVDDELVKQRTLDTLIERELVNQVNETLDLQISAQQVRGVINGLEAFQGGNGFDSYLYERAVLQLGFTPVMFEYQLQEDMKAEQLQNSISGSEFVTTDEINLLASLGNQSRDFSYSVLSSNELKETMSFSDEAIKAYYDSNIKNYMEPEKVRIAYIDLSLQQMASSLDVDEDGLKTFYENNKADYDVEDQRKIRHITISISENAKPDEIDLANQKAESLIALLKSGMSFDELSEKHSADPNLQIEMSELGFLTRGIMAAEIDEVMFSLEEGEISKPILTEKSVDVVRVDKVKGGVKNSLESVREQVEEKYRLSLAETEFFAASDNLANLTYEHPDTLEIAAEELGFSINESGFFNREPNEDPLLADRRIKAAAFSSEVLSGNNSDMLEVADNRIIVLRVLEHVSEQQMPLEEVRERLITRMKHEKASEQVRLSGEKILSQLKEGGDPETIAEQSGIVWTKSTAIKRDNSGINRAVVRTAFRLGRPEDKQAVFGGTGLGSGDYAVIILEAVNEPEPAALKDEEKASIIAQLKRLNANKSWSQLIKDVRESSEVNIFSDRL